MLYPTVQYLKQCNASVLYSKSSLHLLYPTFAVTKCYLSLSSSRVDLFIWEIWAWHGIMLTTVSGISLDVACTWYSWVTACKQSSGETVGKFRKENEGRGRTVNNIQILLQQVQVCRLHVGFQIKLRFESEAKPSGERYQGKGEEGVSKQPMLTTISRT